MNGVIQMKLMTKELEKRFATVGSQKDVKNPIVIARYFNLDSRETWFATEYGPISRTLDELHPVENTDKPPYMG